MLFKSMLSIAMMSALLAGFMTNSHAKDAGDASVEFVTNIENGDVNGDDRRDLTDVVGLLNYLFLNSPAPVYARCEPKPTSDSGLPLGSWSTEVANGDVDGSGRIDITDAIAFLDWLFSGGDEPVALGCGANLS